MSTRTTPVICLPWRESESQEAVLPHGTPSSLAASSPRTTTNNVIASVLEELNEVDNIEEEEEEPEEEADDDDDGGEEDDDEVEAGGDEEDEEDEEEGGETNEEEVKEDGAVLEHDGDDSGDEDGSGDEDTEDVEDEAESEETESDEEDTAIFDGNGGLARAGVAFKDATPRSTSIQGSVVPLFLCLVEHGKCSTFQSKQKMKRHLLVTHNFGTVEDGRVGRPPSTAGRLPRTTPEQHKRWNEAARKNPILKETLLDSKARRRFEISATAAWDKKQNELKKYPVPRTPPPLVKLFGGNTMEFFGIESWESAPISRGVFARFKRNREAHDIIVSSRERYMRGLRGAWDFAGAWKKPENARRRESAYLALSKYAMAKWKHKEWAEKADKAAYVKEKVAAQMAARAY